MLKIRLSRAGKNTQPTYRVVVQEHTRPVKGKFIEVVGHYRPADNPKVFQVDMDRVKHWVSVGAQPSDSLAVLLKKEGLDGMEKFIEPRNKKAKKKKQVEEKAAPAPAAQPAAEVPAEAPASEPVAETPAPEPTPEPAPEAPAPEAEPAPEAPASEEKV